MLLYELVPAAKVHRDFDRQRGGPCLSAGLLLCSASIADVSLCFCRDMRVLGGGVFWPVWEDPSAGWLQASDHRPVYLDVEICDSSTTALSMPPVWQES